jgi:hypothetical protein
MINIGVTGHRNLDKRFIKQYSKMVFSELSNLKQIHSKIMLYSAIADGADRLVVNEAIKLNIDFIAILPMKKEMYKDDFNTSSKIDFEALLEQSHEIAYIPHDNLFIRDLQYELAGHYISDKCDILFALWDGRDTHLQGGTSEIVKYHQSKNNKIISHIKVDRK